MPLTATISRTQSKIRLPGKWKVIILNDDYTPAEFVINVLREVFNKTEEDANKLMLAIHQTGKAQVGSYTKEIAETKVQITMDAARDYNYPLTAYAEEA